MMRVFLSEKALSSSYLEMYLSTPLASWGKVEPVKNPSWTPLSLQPLPEPRLLSTYPSSWALHTCFRSSVSGAKPVIMDMSNIDIVASWSPRYLDSAERRALGPKEGVSPKGLFLDKEVWSGTETSDSHIAAQRGVTFFRKHFPKGNKKQGNVMVEVIKSSDSAPKCMDSNSSSK